MNFFSFIKKDYLYQVIFLALLLGIFVIYAKEFSGQSTFDWIDPIIGVLTFVVAVLVWFNGIWRDYLDCLQKRITVYYQYNGRNVLVCRNALLYNVADARAWSQQIGSQMCGGAMLKLEPFYRLEEHGIKKLSVNKRLVRSYTMTVFLSRLPVFGDKDTPESEREIFAKDIARGYLEWYPAENEDGSFTVQKDWMIGQNQTIRL